MESMTVSCPNSGFKETCTDSVFERVNQLVVQIILDQLSYSWFLQSY